MMDLDPPISIVRSYGHSRERIGHWRRMGARGGTRNWSPREFVPGPHDVLLSRDEEDYAGKFEERLAHIPGVEIIVLMETYWSKIKRRRWEKTSSYNRLADGGGRAFVARCRNVETAMLVKLSL